MDIVGGYGNEFSDEDDSQSFLIDIGQNDRLDQGRDGGVPAVESTDFFGEDCAGYMSTYIESPFEIPRANYQDLGRRKDVLPLLTKTNKNTGNKVELNVGLLPHRDESEDEDDGHDLSPAKANKPQNLSSSGQISSLLQSFQQKNKELNYGQIKKLEGIADPQLPLEKKVFKPADVVYQDKLLQYKSHDIINGVIEYDEIQEDTGILEQIESQGVQKFKKRKNKPVFTQSNSTNTVIAEPIGLTSSVTYKQKQTEKRLGSDNTEVA